MSGHYVSRRRWIMALRVNGTGPVRIFVAGVALAGLINLAKADVSAETAEGVDNQANVQPDDRAEDQAPAYDLAPTVDPDDVEGNLQTVIPESGALIDFGIEEIVPQSWRDAREDLKERGFEIGFAYTAVFQQASGGPGRRNAAGGDVDLFGTWRLVGTPDENPGKLVWAADNRHALFDELTPAELGPEIGTLFDTTDGFNERDLAMRQFFWEQHLWEERLVLSAGKVDAGTFYNGNRGSNDNLFALNKALSANPARFFPEEGLGVNAKVMPAPETFVSTGVHDASAVGTQTGFNTVDDFDLFYAVDFGYTPTLSGDRPGVYRLGTWYNDPVERTGKDHGWGVGLSAAQFITPTAAVVVRYAYQDADDLEIEQVLSAQYISYVGGSRAKDVWGAGAGWGKPTDGDLDDEFITELFYRLQLTRNMQITPDVQVIFSPSNAPDDDVLAVFGIRARFAI